MLPGNVCPCGLEALTHIHTFHTPPQGETKFVNNDKYYRELWRCSYCGHYVSKHTMDLSSLYSGAYTEATYGSSARCRFETIINLPPEKSDNEGRVQRISRLAKQYLFNNDVNSSLINILDVGSGLCVFLYRVYKVLGWHCVALDPDAAAVAHAQEVAGIHAVQGNFLQDDLDALELMKGQNGRFDIITFNKVLEHVEDPVRMLSFAHKILKEKGIVYIEVPDGEQAEKITVNREEFFLEHWHAFSMNSVIFCAHKAHFLPLCVERISEPSGKRTLWAVLQAAEF